MMRFGTHYVPALLTAAASAAPEAWPIPASSIGCWISRIRVNDVVTDIFRDAKSVNSTVSAIESSSGRPVSYKCIWYTLGLFVLGCGNLYSWIP